MGTAGRLAARLAAHAPGERPLRVRVLALAFGFTMFGFVVPALLITLGAWLTGGCGGTSLAQMVASILAVAAGLALMLLTVARQWTTGHGTPVPLVPTQTLITDGVYRLCRNPMVLGALLYFLGLGLLFATPAAALVAVALALSVAVPYHKLVEEQELALRFGAEYEEYRRSTPFLVPRWPGRRAAVGAHSRGAGHHDAQ
jgi:protein-S-isoprenylcysteine O-methyltransferase Ste14